MPMTIAEGRPKPLLCEGEREMIRIVPATITIVNYERTTVTDGIAILRARIGTIGTEIERGAEASTLIPLR